MPNRKKQMLTDYLFTVSKRSHCTYSTGRRYGEHPLWPTKAQNTNVQLKKNRNEEMYEIKRRKNTSYKKKNNGLGKNNSHVCERSIFLVIKP